MFPFKDIADFKAQCEFFPKGRIVPNRVIHIFKTKTGKRYRRAHCFKFSANAWICIAPDGTKIAVSDEATCFLLDGAHNDITLFLAPYGKKGLLYVRLTDIDALNSAIGQHYACFEYVYFGRFDFNNRHQKK